VAGEGTLRLEDSSRARAVLLIFPWGGGLSTSPIIQKLNLAGVIFVLAPPPEEAEEDGRMQREEFEVIVRC